VSNRSHTHERDTYEWVTFLCEQTCSPALYCVCYISMNTYIYVYMKVWWGVSNRSHVTNVTHKKICDAAWLVSNMTHMCWNMSHMSLVTNMTHMCWDMSHMSLIINVTHTNVTRQKIRAETCLLSQHIFIYTFVSTHASHFSIIFEHRSFVIHVKRINESRRSPPSLRGHEQD